MTKEDDFFARFDPPVLRVDPIGPIAELQAQLRIANENAANWENQWKIADNYSAECDRRINQLQAQVTQLQTTISQILGSFCNGCEEGLPVILNSAGYYSHREDGNCCNAHRIHVVLAQIPKEKTA
jgi:hypothetical protein